MGRVEKISLFHTGGFVISRRIFCNALSPQRAFHPLTCAVIHHSEHGPVLFDTGLGSRSYERMKRRPFNLLLKMMPVVFSERIQLLRRLADLGIDPNDVKHVILSHLHMDHTGGMCDLPWALFHVRRSEWDHALAAVGLKAMLKGFIREDYENASTNFIEDDASRPVWPFTASCDLFGDGSVVLIATPGHTRGHQSALVKLASGHEVLLAGDAVLVTQNYSIPADSSLVARQLRWDHETTWRTILKIRAFSTAHHAVQVIPSHDPKCGRLMKRSPWIVT